MEVLLKTDCPDLKLVGRGKVRDIYEIDENLLIVTTDRISAFDVILPNTIPYKGYVLTKLSEFWFEKVKDIVNHHLITTDINEMPKITHKYKKMLENRTMFTKRAKTLPIECVVRGYLAGSAWKEYNKTGSICGIKLREGLKMSSKLDEPIFTPATKEELGRHDENITFDKVESIVGKDIANKIRDYSINIYKRASKYAESRGIIIADTKMEFGLYNDEVILIDELLTPDSSRFWYKDTYKEGVAQDSMDKQFVRDYLERITWDKNPPAPELPDDVIKGTSQKYLEIMHKLTDNVFINI
jgi:phosphoribosylaminoimidazole-succinocarboxamide synthase